MSNSKKGAKNTKNSKAVVANTSASNLSTVYNKLKAGEIKTIAERTGYSPSHVTNVLKGRRNNTAIVSTATKMTSRRK